MAFIERKDFILNYLRDSRIGMVHDFSEPLAVSEATIRRDLQELEDLGFLRRIHGGAALAESAIEPLFNDKKQKNKDSKKRIAEAALTLINDNDRIYLDGGSTILYLARLLNQRKNLTVVTNSILAAATLMDSPHKLVMLGGEFRPISRTLIGALTEPVIEHLQVDKAFMGTIGFSLKMGMTTTASEEAFTKTKIMQKSNQIILLADSSKLRVDSFAKSGSVGDIDVLVTEKIEDDMFLKLKEYKIQVVVA